MKQALIPFYNEMKKDSLSKGYFLDFETMDIYQLYTESQSMDFGLFHLLQVLVYTTFTIVSTMLPPIPFKLAIVLLFIVSISAFYFGYSYLFNKGRKASSFRIVHLTKEEFISYAIKGRKTCYSLLTMLVIIFLSTAIILVYFLSKNTIFLYCFLDFHSFY